MKKIAILLCSLLLVVALKAEKVNFEHAPLNLSQGDKLAIVMVHFGTTNEATRSYYTLINDIVGREFSQAEVFEAYSSRIVIRLLAKKGVKKLTPREMFLSLKQRGYTHLIVQSTHIIDGVEMESLRRDVESVEEMFKEVRVGTPLLYTPDDFMSVARAVTERVEYESDAVVLVGHGTYTPITSSYAMMDYILKSQGHKNWSVATIEGYPTFDDMLRELSQSGAKSVTLVPFMYVAGVHARDDIDAEWREELTKRGYKVDVIMEGMGQNPAIQKIIVEHIRFAFENRHLNIMSKKQKYANE